MPLVASEIAPGGLVAAIKTEASLLQKKVSEIKTGIDIIDINGAITTAKLVIDDPKFNPDEKAGAQTIINILIESAAKHIATAPTLENLRVSLFSTTPALQLDKTNASNFFIETVTARANFIKATLTNSANTFPNKYDGGEKKLREIQTNFEKQYLALAKPFREFIADKATDMSTAEKTSSLAILDQALVDSMQSVKTSLIAYLTKTKLNPENIRSKIKLLALFRKFINDSGCTDKTKTAAHLLMDEAGTVLTNRLAKEFDTKFEDNFFSVKTLSMLFGDEKNLLVKTLAARAELIREETTNSVNKRLEPGIFGGTAKPIEPKELESFHKKIQSFSDIITSLATPPAVVPVAVAISSNSSAASVPTDNTAEPATTTHTSADDITIPATTSTTSAATTPANNSAESVTIIKPEEKDSIQLILDEASLNLTNKAIAHLSTVTTSNTKEIERLQAYTTFVNSLKLSDKNKTKHNALKMTLATKTTATFTVYLTATSIDRENIKKEISRLSAYANLVGTLNLGDADKETCRKLLDDTETVLATRINESQEIDAEFLRSPTVFSKNYFGESLFKKTTLVRIEKITKQMKNDLQPDTEMSIILAMAKLLQRCKEHANDLSTADQVTCLGLIGLAETALAEHIAQHFGQAFFDHMAKNPAIALDASLDKKIVMAHTSQFSRKLTQQVSESSQSTKPAIEITANSVRNMAQHLMRAKNIVSDATYQQEQLQAAHFASRGALAKHETDVANAAKALSEDPAIQKQLQDLDTTNLHHETEFKTKIREVLGGDPNKIDNIKVSALVRALSAKQSALTRLDQDNISATTAAKTVLDKTETNLVILMIRSLDEQYFWSVDFVERKLGESVYYQASFAYAEFSAYQAAKKFMGNTTAITNAVAVGQALKTIETFLQDYSEYLKAGDLTGEQKTLYTAIVSKAKKCLDYLLQDPIANRMANELNPSILLGDHFSEANFGKALYEKILVKLFDSHRLQQPEFTSDAEDYSAFTARVGTTMVASKCNQLMNWMFANRNDLSKLTAAPVLTDMEHLRAFLVEDDETTIEFPTPTTEQNRNLVYTSLAKDHEEETHEPSTVEADKRRTMNLSNKRAVTVNHIKLNYFPASQSLTPAAILETTQLHYRQTLGASIAKKCMELITGTQQVSTAALQKRSTSEKELLLIESELNEYIKTLAKIFLQDGTIDTHPKLETAIGKTETQHLINQTIVVVPKQLQDALQHDSAAEKFPDVSNSVELSVQSAILLVQSYIGRQTTLLAQEKPQKQESSSASDSSTANTSSNSALADQPVVYGPPVTQPHASSSTAITPPTVVATGDPVVPPPPSSDALGQSPVPSMK